MVAVRVGSGYEFSIVTSHKLWYMFLVPLSIGVLSQLKMATSFFVKSVEQLESHICPIERMLELLRFRYVSVCVAVDGDMGRGRCPEIFG